MRPSNFTSRPMGSILGRIEYEIVAQNIMIILKRTGNEFRELSFEEYRTERREDGNFRNAEEKYFNEAIKYCISTEAALCLCGNWAN